MFQTNKMKVFVSRPLSDDSIFLMKMQQAKIDVSAQSLIKFSALPFEVPTQTDWLFFYSKKGVKYFFEKVSLSSERPKIACIGQGTANYLQEKTGLNSDFVGNGAPKESAQAFLEVAKQQRVTFVRAMNSKKSVQQFLEHKIISIDCIVYQNHPIDEQYLFSGEILVFTSPLNVKTYFNLNRLGPTQKVVAIGQSTAAALTECGIIQIHIAPEPTELALAETVLKLIV